MDFVDPPESEAPSTSIHRGRHDHNDPAGLENPDMINKEDSIQTMKRILISIWSPYARFLLKWYREDQELQVRLKRSDQVVQKVIQGNEEDMGSTAVSNLNILKSLYHGMFEIDDLRKNSYAITSPSSSSSSVFAGEVEEQVEGLKERLIVFRNFLWLIPNPLLINYQDCVCVFDGAQMIALTIPPFLYVVVCSINDEELTWELGDAFRLLLAGIDNIISELIDEYLETLLMAAASHYDYDDYDDNPSIDEKGLEFLDYLIHKLKLMMWSGNEDGKESFLRCNFMEDLLLFNLKNPIIKEIISLTISTRALIFKVASLVCKSRDFKEEDERIVEYCCFKIPDLLGAVDDIRQKASDLFNHYFFSSRKSWQSSNCPSTTNVLEYVNFIINKLEQLLRSKAHPLNALEPHMEKVNEQLVFLRKLLCDIAQLLGNSHMEFLLTRFKDAAYQAEYVIDSFMATGEGSIWGHKLGLFVVIEDFKILHKELKAAMLTMMTTCDTVIPTISSSSLLQANYYVKGGSKGEIYNMYEFLRVLDLGNVRLGSCADTSDFVNIAKLVHLSSSAADSVNQILEEQRDMSNVRLNVIVVGIVRSCNHGGSGDVLSVRR
ncbi:hypothetical protein ACH5RR_002937 [Cinchona calisaya]|uniref:Disease resistance N-terminal domain-containing protein n=1 Tax=Cinchona calisaya TaxID=153742 RepID=A0ABD3ATF7_9GENT